MTRGAMPSRAVRALRTAASAACLAVLTACSGVFSSDEAPDSGNLLRDSLPVAAAALGAGQLDVARRLYLSLAERFTEAPEPVLGLGYVAYFASRFAEAERRFRQAAARSAGNPALQSEALTGAGRSAIAQGKTGEARELYRSARDLGPAVPPAAAAWVRNGLAVTATLDGDYRAAEAHFEDAIRLSSGDPRITANFVRMLAAAGRVDEARKLVAAHPPSYWPGGDGPVLARLVEEPRPRPGPRLAGLGEAGPREAGTASERAPSTSRAAPPSPHPPDRFRTGARESASRPPPPRPGLSLRLSRLVLSPPLPRAFEPAAHAGASPLLLRFASFPAALALAAPPAPGRPARHAPAPRPVPEAPFAAAPRPDHSTGGAAAPEAPVEPPGSERPGRPSPDILHLTVGESRRLRTERAASAVSVASPEVADVQLLAPNVVYVIARTVGRTSVALLLDDEWSEERIVSVTLDLDPLRAILAADRDLRAVQARTLARGVALTGEVESVEIADRALRLAAATLPEDVPIENGLRTGGPQQVNLEVQIAEVNRSITENLGVSWEALRVGGDGIVGLRIGRKPTDDSGNLNPVAFEGQPAASLYFGRQTGSSRIGAMVDALSVAGLANVLARPNLTAVSGEPASFFSGGEFPLPTGFEDGVIAFEYKKYGVLLDFVPTVVDSGRIVLTVRPEVSEPSTSQSVSVAAGVSVPVINVRRAETTVEVGDGESIVIAGLFRNRTNTVESGVPGLKDVPLLGALFEHTSNRSDEVELIVIVTARLVDANAAARTGDASATEDRRQTGGYHY